MPSKQKKMTHGGRELVTIEINGETLRPRDTVFVVWNPDGKPVGTVMGSTTLLDRFAAAARSYWYNPDSAIEHLNQGYRITLHTMKDFGQNIAANVEYEN